MRWASPSNNARRKGAALEAGRTAPASRPYLDPAPCKPEPVGLAPPVFVQLDDGPEAEQARATLAAMDENEIRQRLEAGRTAHARENDKGPLPITTQQELEDYETFVCAQLLAFLNNLGFDIPVRGAVQRAITDRLWLSHPDAFATTMALTDAAMTDLKGGK